MRRLRRSPSLPLGALFLAVCPAVARVLPSISASDSLTSVQLNEDRYALGGESAEECEARLGRVCDDFVDLGGQIALPDETWSQSVAVTARQSLWSSSAVMGISQARKRGQLSELTGRRQLEEQAWELVQA